jgi:hypothetical protein
VLGDRGIRISVRREGDRYIGTIALPRQANGRRPFRRVTASSRAGVGVKMARSVTTSVVDNADQVWRSATVGLRAVPDFLMIGTQRSGSTSLYEWLCERGDVGRAAGKELHYFDRDFGRGSRWYRAQFPLARPGRLAAEATPDLLFHPLAPERVAAELPDSVRFVVVLREPAERAVSHYWLQRRRRIEDEPLERALELEPERLAGQLEVVMAGGRSLPWEHFSYVSRGEYAGQLRRWFDHFDRDRFHVTTSEQMFSSEATRLELVRWLGGRSSDHSFAVHNNARRRDDTSAAAIDQLRRHFCQPNEELFDLLGVRLWADAG